MELVIGLTVDRVMIGGTSMSRVWSALIILDVETEVSVWDMAPIYGETHRYKIMKEMDRVMVTSIRFWTTIFLVGSPPSRCLANTLSISLVSSSSLLNM